MTTDSGARLALDLHDGPLQELSFLVGQLAALREEVAGGGARADVLARLDEVGGVLAAVEREVRALAEAFAAPGDDRVSLREGLTAAVEAFERRFGISVEHAIGDDGAGLAPEQRIAVVQVAREALTNAGRHSGAGTVSLFLRVDRGGVLLEVRDDGDGVPAAARDGLGLPGMRQRMASCGGSLTVEPAPGGGTVVSARLPAPGGGLGS